MKRILSLVVAPLVLALSVTLSGCGSDDPSSTSTSTSPAASETPTSPGGSTTPEATSSPADPSYKANDATQACTDLAEKSGPILMKALENATDPDAFAKSYTELADLYEAGVAKVESQDAKDAFQSLADAYRDIAKNKGVSADSDALNQANEDFGSACFGG